MSSQYCIKVSGITCASCTGSIEKALKKAFGKALIKFDANIALETVTVEVDDTVTQAKLVETINDTGFEVDSVNTIVQRTHVQTNNSLAKYLVRAAVAGSAGLTLLILSLIGLTIPLYGLIFVAFVSLPLVVFASHNIFYNAYKALRHSRTFTMDTLFSISIVAVFMVSIVSMVLPGLGIPIFFSATLLIPAFRCLGIAIDKKTKRQVLKEKHFIDRTPVSATVITDGNALNPKTAVRAVKDIKMDDLIKISQGNMIPLDGEIVQGSASVKQTIWTGDQQPKTLTKSDKVLAGMKLLDGDLTVRVTKDYDNSLLARIDQNIISAQSSKPAIEKLTNKIVKVFVPTVVALAALSFLLVAILVSPINAISTSISVLCVACPCVFGWLVPVSSSLAMTKAAQNNAYFAKGGAMQTISKVDTVVFDKTGTLTEPNVVSVECNKQQEQNLLGIATALEQGSDHILAYKVNHYCRAKKIQPLKNVTQLEDMAQKGRSGLINGVRCLIGNERMLQSEKISYDVYKNKLAALHAEGKNALFVVENSVVLGMIVMDQVVKPSAKETISALRKQGVKNFKICTGSDRAPAVKMAADLGIPEPDVLAEQTPEQKLVFVRQLQMGGDPDDPKNKKRKHVVAYVGDGGNDASAMQGSDVSFVMSSGDQICKNKADVVLPDYSLKPLANSFAVAKQATKNIKLNLGITMAFNLIMITIAAGAFIPLGFTLTPAIAAAFMIAQALVVLASAYVFKRQKLPGAKQINKVSTAPVAKKSASIFVKKIQLAKQPESPAKKLPNTPAYSY